MMTAVLELIERRKEIGALKAEVAGWKRELSLSHAENERLRAAMHGCVVCEARLALAPEHPPSGSKP